ncbi:MAG: phage tail tube protein [Bacillota bacterium]
MAIAGKNGKLQIGDSTPITVVGIKNWSLDLSLDTLDTTTLGKDWKEYITGLKEWSASADGDFNIHTDTTGQEALQKAFLEGTTVKVYLYVDGVHAYVGDAYVSSLSIEDPVDDIVSVSIDFTGSGEITFGGDSE